MHQNVGPRERLVRLALGTAAGAAAMAMPRGWQRSTLCGISTAGFLTALTRYCPLNAALGVDRSSERSLVSEHDLSVRNTEIRRETQTSGAMGPLPGTVEPIRPVGATS
jgi:hypothetical protein